MALFGIISSPVYQNAHVDSVCENVWFHSMFILFLLVTFINQYKGKYLFRTIEEFLVLLMDRNCNPFATSNQQAHIQHKWKFASVALWWVRFFSHTSEPLTPTSVVLSHKRACNYITDNQHFSLLFSLFVTFIDGNTAFHNILVFK